MTAVVAGGREQVLLPASGRRRVTATLCVTQLVGWGVLFYAFPVLLGSITADTGWSAVTVTACFTIGQLLAALAGIPIGRVVDRHGPRWVMTAGSVLAVVAIVLVASAPSLGWFLAAWTLAGAAKAASLYPPAFAAITRWHDADDRVRALTVLTVAGGLASTVFAPLTAVLEGALGWRATYLVLAAVLAAVTIPGHVRGLRGPWPTSTPHPSAEHSPAGIVRSRAFLALAAALALTGLSAYVVVVHLVPLLGERGIGVGTAGVVLGLGGLGQVAGRIGYSALARRLSAPTRAALILALLAVTTALLGVLHQLWALVVVALLAGVGRGLLTLVHATAVTDRWGTQHYGRLSGILSAPLAVSIALAPWAGALLATYVGSYATAFLVLAVVTLVAAGLVLASQPKRPEM